MKMPMPPRPLQDLIESVDRQKLTEIFVAAPRPIVDGKYLHWDELRHREPPAGLTPEQWWLGVKYARAASAEHLPLFQINETGFTLVYASPVRQKLHLIDQRLAKGQSSPSIDVLDVHEKKYNLMNSLMEEAIRSSQLEGASTTRARAKKMIREGRPANDRSERMILNNLRAMERLEELSTERLTVEVFFELHRILVDGTLDDPSDAGVFRTDEDQVVVKLLHSVETAHTPPPAEELPRRLDQLVSFANAETPDSWVHPVVRAVIVHFMVGYDHPFVDGNGRVARALFYWTMLRSGYDLAKYMSISRIFHDAPAKYARAYLFTETDGGDLTYFVDHHLDVINQSIDQLQQYWEEKLEQTTALEKRLLDVSQLNHRQIALLTHGLRHPGFKYTITAHMRSHRVSRGSARTDLLTLAAMGLVEKLKQGREMVFFAPRDLEDRLAELETPKA